MPFENQRVLVTGGSSGIGLALALRLAAAGAHISLLARRPERLAAAQEAVRAACVRSDQQVEALVGDVSCANEVTPLLNEWIKRNGPPNYVFNSAGISHPGYFQDLPLDIFEQMMSVNYFGTVYVTKAVVPAMLAAQSGHIVNISSVAGFLGVFGYTAYGASKFAVRGFSDALRAELKPQGIQVSIVFPPDTDTPQLAYEMQFKPPETRHLSGGHALSADAVAKSILAHVEKKRYIIIPDLESRLYFNLSGLLGDLLYPVMDWMVADARQKTAQGKKSR
ncbi:MAG TPA: SDR family oxidoreductase [Anaerolineaceae bacterium]|nr:SDR family oxidoreductase [Anaerolineaceae bacterium]HPN51144.1 SDR family oxidoreductase [Anaerolineaceae bacterium]